MLCVECGEDGHRSHYLAHAKRALYHLSYIPVERESNSLPSVLRSSAMNAKNKGPQRASHTISPSVVNEKRDPAARDLRIIVAIVIITAVILVAIVSPSSSCRRRCKAHPHRRHRRCVTFASSSSSLRRGRRRHPRPCRTVVIALTLVALSTLVAAAVWPPWFH